MTKWLTTRLVGHMKDITCNMQHECVPLRQSRKCCREKLSAPLCCGTRVRQGTPACCRHSAPRVLTWPCTVPTFSVQSQRGFAFQTSMDRGVMAHSHSNGSQTTWLTKIYGRGSGPANSTEVSMGTVCSTSSHQVGHAHRSLGLQEKSEGSMQDAHVDQSDLQVPG